MADRVANIGEAGARRRRRSGSAWAIVAVVALALLAARSAPRVSTLILFVPVALAVMGFLQAREKT